MQRSGLHCRQLSFVRPDQKRVLEQVDAHFAPGEATLISGPTGAGKSTLLHLLAGLLRPTGGEVWADGAPVSRWPAPHRDRWRRKVGMLFQHLNLLPDLTVVENVVLPCIPTATSYSEVARRARVLLERLDIDAYDQEAVRTLSGGEQQRVAIARALIVEPHFLLLDEPTSFQDDAATRCLITLIAEAAGAGACVVVCTHDVRMRNSERSFRNRYRLNLATLEPDP